MKVFLLPLDHQRSSVFYSEDEDEDAAAGDPSPGRPGLLGWFRRTARGVKSSLKHPEGRFARKVKQTWDWLHRRMQPDERLLAALRSAPGITVYHRPSLSGDAVRDLWFAYLRRRFRRSLPWLIFHTLLAPVAVLLTPLPGPNVIGYWFAYRAVHHLLVLRGIRRVLSGRVETTFAPVVGLDASGQPADRSWLSRAATEFELKGLHDFVERIESGPSTATAVGEDEDEVQGVNARDRT